MKLTNKLAAVLAAGLLLSACATTGVDPASAAMKARNLYCHGLTPEARAAVQAELTHGIPVVACPPPKAP